VSSTLSKAAETAEGFRSVTEKSRERLKELELEFIEEIRSRCDEKIEENELFLKGCPKISLYFHNAFKRFAGSRERLEEARVKIEGLHDKLKECLCDECNTRIDDAWQRLGVHECAIDFENENGSSVPLNSLVPLDEE